ncbi:MAG: DUF3857 domain-containing protein, partial [Bacteroidales bacterium]
MIRKIYFLLLLACSVPNLMAQPSQTRHQSIKAEDYPGANVVVVFDSTVADVQETGLTFVEMHRLYKVLTPAGALQMSVVKIDYDPLSAYVEIRKVVVHRGRGEEGKKGSGEEENGGSYEVVSPVLDYPAPARAIYWGAREKMIEVGRLEPGDAVEVWLFRKGFTYALLGDPDDDSRYIPPMRGHFYDIIPFYSSDPIIEKVYQVAIPSDKMVQYEFYHGEVRSSVVPRDDKMVYTFVKKDIKPLKREPNMVDFSDVAPKLLISTSPDWYAKSVWFYGVNEDYGSFESTPAIDAKVAEILQN